MMDALPFFEPAPHQRLVFVRDLVMLASIGVYPHEHTKRQRVRLSVCLAVEDEASRMGQTVGRDELSRVVDYEKLVTRVRQIVAEGHTRLVETLAERIAAEGLRDPRVRHAVVTLEKLDVFDDLEAVGVQVRRSRDPSGMPSA